LLTHTFHLQAAAPNNGTVHASSGAALQEATNAQGSAPPASELAMLRNLADLAAHTDTAQTDGDGENQVPPASALLQANLAGPSMAVKVIVCYSLHSLVYWIFYASNDTNSPMQIFTKKPLAALCQKDPAPWVAAAGKVNAGGYVSFLKEGMAGYKQKVAELLDDDKISTASIPELSGRGQYIIGMLRAPIANFVASGMESGTLLQPVVILKPEGCTAGLVFVVTITEGSTEASVHIALSSIGRLAQEVKSVAALKKWIATVKKLKERSSHVEWHAAVMQRLSSGQYDA
jgi:hypothetical protein